MAKIMLNNLFFACEALNRAYKSSTGKYILKRIEKTNVSFYDLYEEINNIIYLKIA